MAESDYYTKHGAGVIAATVESYWHERGAHQVRAERYELPGMDGLWGVRSNLVAGRPPALASGGIVSGVPTELFGERAG